MPDARDLHVREYVLYAVGACLVIMSVALRLTWYPFVTSDYTYFVKQWMDIFGATPGLSRIYAAFFGLRTTVSLPF